MKYSDELLGSEDERCTVTDLRIGLQSDGVVIAVHEKGVKVDVRYDSGETVRVGYSFVSLHGEEKV